MEKYIVVNTNENLEDKLFRVNKKTRLKLKPGPKFIAQDVTLKTNYPLKKNSKFQRNNYHELSIQSDAQDSISSALNWSVSLQLDLAGTFHFVCSSSFSAEPIWQAYVIVNPELKVPINSIKCQTVLAKNLGPNQEWRKRLTVTKEANYNMIHFTPVQELGASNSAYSLRNQHKVNPLFKATLDDIKKDVDFMEKRWGVLSLTDIVLNHTADDSEWIRKHPECAYNMVNSPHLRPAFLLDSAFIWLAKDMALGLLEKTFQLSDMIVSEREVSIVAILLKTFYVAQLRIYELFMIDIGEAVAKFNKLPRAKDLSIDYGLYERKKAKVLTVPDSVRDVHQFHKLLQEENLRKTNEIKAILNQAIDNALGAIRYERLNPNGPYFGRPVSPNEPLVAPYFAHTNWETFSIASEELAMYKAGELFMAHNGWVMGAATVEDFACKESNVYLARQLVAWGDCIKLRYGTSASQVPYLWEHMRKYVESQAKVFHGFRIDNCHSTPLHVAEFVVDTARSVRPDIYIMAELFTSSESVDNIYVNRLGITALVREAMSAHDSRELGRLCYRFGGTPVGAFYQPGGEEPLKPGVANAIFFDQTHDNESAIVKRTAYDVPATAALLSMANCATGSSRGYDELVPHHINVVTESRFYPLEVPEDHGILPLRRILNGVLKETLDRGFSEIFVDQRNDHVIAITRQNPVDGRSIVLLARTAFSREPSACLIPPLIIEGQIKSILFEAQAYGNPDKYFRDEQFINGLSAFKTKIFSQNAAPGQCKLAKIDQLDGNKAEVSLNEFQFLPSSVLAFEVHLCESQSKALQFLNQWEPNVQDFNLNLCDINYILFRRQEEDNFEPYALPGFCDFTYTGLYGLMYHLQKVRENQDQAHPLAKNLRDGNWLSEYIVGRLRQRESTRGLADHLEQALKQVHVLPRGMVPKYFDLVITKLYNEIVGQIYKQMNGFVREGPKMMKLMALSSVALVGECESAPLPAIESNRLPYLPSIAAGLPHFASGFMRNWGRDTFIALRGLLLVTGRYADARAIILAYARTLKHGLIPNLLDGGQNSRYNCRDAVWWWLYSIREYCKMVPNGAEILRQRVKRLHKPELLVSNGPQRKRSTAQMNGVGGGGHTPGSQQLCDIMQEALECHFKGMEFVEERAGKQLDEHMTERGFTVTYGVRRDTGFVFGGNEFNCGTWMDKMGSSVKAGNKGKPASPRDGSAIEIVGLCKAVVSWLDEMFKNGRAYPYDGVESLYDNTITLKWPWKKWANLIQANFEKCFFVPFEKTNEPGEELVNRRGIYKDTLNASRAWQDFQFRPNFLVAMVVAPELFDKVHARHAILLAKEHLCGPLGMKTLDNSDWNYCGDYDNGNDSMDEKVAHGFNYHQGPEWLWLTGYYIRASSKFIGHEERPHHLKLLSNFYATLMDSPWLGLPELTNTDGSVCKDSCPIQAWSLATVMETLYESARNYLATE